MLVWLQYGSFALIEVIFAFQSPTDPFKPRDQEIGDFYKVKKRRVTDLEAPKL